VLKKLLTPTPLRSVPVADDESHRVNTKYKGNPKITPVEGVSTLHELALYACKKFGHCRSMGQRQYLGPLSTNPKIQTFGKNVTYRTYDQVKDESLKFGASLRSAGLVPSATKGSLDQLTTPCTLAIFENTCPEWMIGAIGAFSQSISITTVYSTLGVDAVIDSINDGRIRAILCNKKSVPTLLSKIKSMPTLKYIVYSNNMVAPDEVVGIPSSNELPSGVKVMSFEEFVDAGDTKAFPAVPPTPDTTAVIMYTSGSTGERVVIFVV
jgi:long-subunit acyl-CoA synthetase (AMP-forming)